MRHILMLTVQCPNRSQPFLSQLTDTFVKCRQNMTQFAVVLCICIGAFDVMGVLMFGGKFLSALLYGGH